MRYLILTLLLAGLCNRLSAQDELNGTTWNRFSNQSISFKAVGDNLYEVVEYDAGLYRTGHAALLSNEPRKTLACVFYSPGNNPGNYDALLYLEFNETRDRLIGKYARGLNVEQLMYIKN